MTLRGSIQQKDTKILNLCATSNKASKYINYEVKIDGTRKEADKFKISKHGRRQKTKIKEHKILKLITKLNLVYV